MVCDLSNICDDGSGNWEQTFQGFEEYPSSVSAVGSSWISKDAASFFPSTQLSCSDPQRLEQHVGSISEFEYDSHVHLVANTYQCKAHRISNPAQIFNAGNTQQVDGCPTGYTQSGSICNLDSSPHPPTEQDWTDAETALNDEQFIQPLFDAGESLMDGHSPAEILHNSPSSFNLPYNKNRVERLTRSKVCRLRHVPIPT